MGQDQNLDQRSGEAIVWCYRGKSKVSVETQDFGIAKTAGYLPRRAVGTE